MSQPSYTSQIYKLKENDVDMIIPNLWLGNTIAAMDENFIRQNNIKYILNVTENIPCPFLDITYYHVPIKDKLMCDEKSRNVMLNYIDDSIDFIHKGLCEGVGVLVHCKRGHHRSSGMVVAFLMKYMNIGFLPACIYIKNIRPFALDRKTCTNKWNLEYYKKNLGL